MEQGLTPQPKERPSLSIGHLTVAVTVFSIFAEPALPVCAVEATAILADPSFAVHSCCSLAT